MQSPSAIKDISIKSNKTFLLEFFNHFFHVYSNKTIDNFKKKNINNFSTQCLNTLNIDYLYKNKIYNANNVNNNINNNEFTSQIFFPKISSEHSLILIDDNKKIINDNNKVFDWNENINNSGDMNCPKFGIFNNSSFNNLSNPEPFFNYKGLASKSLSSGMNRVPSFGNINNISNYNNLNSIGNINFSPNKNYNILDMCMNSSFNSMTNLNNLNQMNNMNINTIKNSNANLLNNSNSNLLQLKGTLLSPPPQILFSLGKTPIIPMAEKNKKNLTIVNSMKEKNIIAKDKEKKNNTLNMFNKKRKRDIKNNKYVFFLGDNKKEKKEKEKEKNVNNINNINNTENTDTTPNQTQTANFESNDFCSEKSKKPRGSKYRGVSRNGNQWQVLIMVNKKKRYVGSYSKEDEAARAYDKVALQNHGPKAKTNFDYTKQEVENILASPQLLKL